MTTEGRDIRVLLVDDEDELIEYLSKRLLREGFVVRCASSGEEAAEVVEREDFDVAVVDLKMPGIDGIETLKRLKARRPMLKFIVLTGHGSIESALESGRCDVFRYLQKPTEQGELSALILEAGELKRREQQERFLEGVQDIAMTHGTAGAIHGAVEALRHKLGMD